MHFSDSKIRFTKYYPGKFDPQLQGSIEEIKDEIPEVAQVNDFDIQIYKMKDKMHQVNFKDAEPRQAKSNSPRRSKKFDILPSLLQGSKGSPTRTDLHNTDIDRLRIRAKVLESKRAQERELDKRKRLAVLDNLVETHLMMKMYEESAPLERTFGAFNRVAILNQIWSKVCAHEGQWQPVLQFMQREIMRFVLTTDDAILDCIARLHEIQQFEQPIASIQEKRIVTYSEACEILQKQVVLQLSKQELDLTRYKGELQSQRNQIESNREQSGKLIDSLQQEVHLLRNDKTAKENNLLSRIQLQDQEHQQLIQQIQELKDQGYRNKERFDQAQTRISQEFQNTIREQNIKLFEQKVLLGDQKELITKLKFMSEDYKNKFLVAFASMKTAADRIRVLELEKSQLVSEHSNLSLRAASTFQELTPRPDFGAMQQYLRVENRHMNNKSTREIVAVMLQSLVTQMDRLRNENVVQQQALEESRAKQRQKDFKRLQSNDDKRKPDENKKMSVFNNI